MIEFILLCPIDSKMPDSEWARSQRARFIGYIRQLSALWQIRLPEVVPDQLVTVFEPQLLIFKRDLMTG